MPTMARHTDTLYLPLGANGFFRSALMAISTANTSWMYGARNTAAPMSATCSRSTWGSSQLTRQHELCQPGTP
jgi:hypothetical protein